MFQVVLFFINFATLKKTQIKQWFLKHLIYSALEPVDS